jgi:hypothetical protein
VADHQTGIRLPTTALERADRLAEALRDDPEVGAMGPVTRSGVLRLAIALGLDEIERRNEPKAIPFVRLPHGVRWVPEEGPSWHLRSATGGEVILTENYEGGFTLSKIAAEVEP